MLRRDMQDRSTRRKHLHRFRALQQLHHPRRRVPDVLEVVDDQQQWRAGRPDGAPHGIERRFAGVAADVERLGNRLGHETKIGEGTKRHKADRITEGRPQFGAELQGETGFPDTARTGQRDPSHVVPCEDLSCARHVAIAADEPRGNTWQVRSGERAAGGANVGNVIVDREQITVEVAGREITIARPLRQTAIDRPLEGRRHMRRHAMERLRFFRDHGRRCLDVGPAGEGATTGRQLV